jgi:hypothetical protein
MLDVLWKKAKNGSGEAIDRALKIMQRRAALYGLDAPEPQSNVTITEPNQGEPTKIEVVLVRPRRQD